MGVQRGTDPQQPALAAVADVEMGDDYFANGEEGFLDAAPIIKNCDLVITADTSVLHLAGALNRPVWTPLNPNADWRWLTDGIGSHWYPGLRLFRVDRFGDLSDAFAEMEGELGKLI